MSLQSVTCLPAAAPSPPAARPPSVPGTGDSPEPRLRWATTDRRAAARRPSHGHWHGVQAACQCGPPAGLPSRSAAAAPAGAITATSRGCQCHFRAGGAYSDPGRRRGVDGVVESRIPITRPDLAVSGRRSARACRVSERLVTSSGWYDSDRPLRRMMPTGPP